MKLFFLSNSVAMWHGTAYLNISNPSLFCYPSKISLEYLCTCPWSQANSWKWKDIILPLFKGASHVIERRQEPLASWKDSHRSTLSPWKLQEIAVASVILWEHSELLPGLKCGDKFNISVSLTMAIISNKKSQAVIRNAGARLQRNEKILWKHQKYT